MKIELNQTDTELLNNLFENKQINMNVADMLIQAFLDESAINPANINKEKELESYYENLLDYYGLDLDDEENVSLCDEYIKNNLSKAHIDTFKQNHYAQNVLPKEKTYNGYSIKYIIQKPYQLFPLDEINVDSKTYKEYSKIGYFDQEFSYLALLKNNNIWMSLNPNELNTMKPFIDSMSGNVLILGLGMGYVPYMLSLKDDIKSITVVELDKNIINIFNETLFPYFSCKNKIKIIQSDALVYLSDSKKKYDFVFADLWHNPEDGLLPFIKLQSIVKEKNIKVQYWLEKSLIAMIRRCALSVMQESILGYKDKDYQYSKCDTDKVINAIYFKTKNTVFKNFQEIMEFLSDENLINLVI